MFSLLAEFIYWADTHRVLAATGAILLVLYYYLTWTHNHWTKLGIPQDRPLPIIGTYWQAFTKPMPKAVLDGHKKHGRVYGGYFGRHPFLWISDLNLIRHICVKDFNHFTDRLPLPFVDRIFQDNLVNKKGDEWRRLRAIVTPVFSSVKLKKMNPIVDECAVDLVKQLDTYCGPKTSGGTGRGSRGAGSGKEVLISDVFGNFSLDVIARCAFAIRTRSATQESELVKQLKIFFRLSLSSFVPYLTLPTSIVDRFHLGPVPRKTVLFFERVTQQIIEDRRELLKTIPADEQPVDFLQLSLDATSPNQSAAAAADSRQQALTDFEIQASALVFMISGYNTIAAVLSFAVYSMAVNPQEQEKLFQELINLKPGTAGESDEYDAIFNAPYLNAFLNESMRLYTIGIKLDRVATKDYTLPPPYSHVTIKKGQEIALSYLAIHHDPEYWPEPEKFDPDRFLPPNDENIVPYSFIPFGVGPRNCFAMRFALMEIKLALARVVKQFRFYRSPSTDVPLEFEYLNIALKAKRIIVGVERRAPRASE